MQSLPWPEVPCLFTSNFGVAASSLPPPRLGHFRYVHNSDVLTPTTLHGKGGEFFAGFGYALDENPACSIGGARAIWA